MNAPWRRASLWALVALGHATLVAALWRPQALPATTADATATPTATPTTADATDQRRTDGAVRLLLRRPAAPPAVQGPPPGAERHAPHPRAVRTGGPPDLTNDLTNDLTSDLTNDVTNDVSAPNVAATDASAAYPPAGPAPAVPAQAAALAAPAAAETASAQAAAANVPASPTADDGPASLADHRHCAPAPHPAALRARGIEGAVTVRVKVDADGRAADVQVLASSGWRLFDEAALQQVRGCRFQPARRAGRPVDSWVAFAVRFALGPGS